MKNRRQQLILQAVEKGEVSTQEQIIEYLRAHGEAAAQATVSRDVKVLGLRKSAGPGGRTSYELPPSSAESARRRTVLGSSILSVEGAGNIACVRCSPGMAQGVCAFLDAMPPEGVIGSLAGDDSIFLLCRGEAEMRAVVEVVLGFAGE
ncbi:MAG: ArgR family transcriptional regulator [Oscillospiraceae bacterium]|nr:ArgR family transcriptional regulator [Oscillospiraceae bacterium]